jgi:hypothetical protein
MLRRLPRALLAVGRATGGHAGGGAGALPALHTVESQRFSRGAEGTTAWRAAGTASVAVTASALLAAQASAEEQAPPAAAAPPPDPSSVLRGLKKLSDAKEVVLYQYATCPFCNKARRRQRGTPARLCVTPAARPPRSCVRSWTSTRSPTKWWRSTRSPKRS